MNWPTTTTALHVSIGSVAPWSLGASPKVRRPPRSSAFSSAQQLPDSVACWLALFWLVALPRSATFFPSILSHLHAPLSQSCGVELALHRISRLFACFLPIFFSSFASFADFSCFSPSQTRVSKAQRTARARVSALIRQRPPINSFASYLGRPGPVSSLASCGSN
jgi:hypothetical protein